MNGQIDWMDLFFAAEGRSTRGPSWLAAVILVGLAALYEALVEGFWIHVLTGWFVYPALFYAGACVLSKRLHDRGRSGWWAALILFATVAVWPHPSSFFDFLFMLILIWAVVELGVMPGEAGANRFGPNPMRAAFPSPGGEGQTAKRSG